MITQKEYLRANYRENMPAWLANYRKEVPLTLGGFLKSRIVYYPGSRVDGHPVEVFGGSHSAHCFVYADYSLEEPELRAELKQHGFLGYSIYAEKSFSRNELLGAIPFRHQHVTAEEALRAQAGYRQFATVSPFALLVVLQRKNGFGEDHGPERLAILFLGADGHAAYDAIFGNGNAQDLFGFLQQDHGFGGNYDVFGPGGLCELISDRTGVKPLFILGADGRVTTGAWKGYRLVEDIKENGIPGGRRLFLRR